MVPGERTPIMKMRLSNSYLGHLGEGFDRHPERTVC